MRKRSWEPFAVGTEVGGAVILEQVNSAPHQRDLTYTVRWTCCDREGTQTHAQLNKRVREGRVACWHCARKLQGQAVGLLNKRDAPKADEPSHAIEIPLPGISGRWSHFGKIGPRYGGTRGTDFGSRQ